MAGRPSDLTNELFSQIRDCVLDGCDMKATAERLNIPVTTLYTWSSDNYLGFADKFLSYKHERIIKKAEAKLEVAIASEKEEIALKAATFALETLNRDKYSKRTENTGKNGEPIKHDVTGNVIIYKSFGDATDSQ